MREFKSYYVVWKLNCFLAAAILDIGFKSYYVVWKRESAPYNIAVPVGLNRTM